MGRSAALQSVNQCSSAESLFINEWRFIKGTMTNLSSFTQPHVSSQPLSFFLM